MAKRKTDEYTFADAYIGSCARRLMKRQDLMRLAACRDVESAEVIMREYGYGEAKEHEHDIEAFIRREQSRLFNLIYDTIPDRRELAMYLFPYDYHNVKVALKSEFLGVTPSEDFLVSTGDTDWKKLVSMVRDRNYTFMTSHMKEAVEEATDLFSRGGDPQEIDLIMDKACYRDMLEAAEENGEEFIIGMVKVLIDAANMKTYARFRKFDRPWSFFQKVFLEGGNISGDFFINHYDEPYDQLAEKLAPYGFRETMSEGGKELRETGNFTVFERLADDVVMKYNKEAKYVSFGIVPIAGYGYAKEIEIDNLRIILTGISMGASADEIGERIREPYV